MHRTLVFFPHEVAGLPVFGFGWVLIALCVGLFVRLAWAHKHEQSVSQVLLTEGLMWGIAIVAVAFLLPIVELKNVDDEPVGMAIRGYGVMLLAGVASAVALAAYRAKKYGINPDVILSMAPWAFVGGIAGARIFYVIQYREKFVSDSIGETLRNVFAFTEGGLVVYGSFIGGFIALTIFVVRNRLPWFRFGDVIVPCLFIGVFFGRIGCLMNGCCYGGRCEESWAALHFPAGSAVYREQIGTGELLGMTINPASRKVDAVQPGSVADDAKIPVGARVEEIAKDMTTLESAPRDIPAEDVNLGVIATVGGQRYRWSPAELPPRALAVQPVQLISSAASLLLCILLCTVSRWLPREGTVMMLGFASYAVLRYVLELVRVDEVGQFGTSLSISQIVSVVVFTLCMSGLFWLYRQDVASDEERSADEMTPPKDARPNAG